MLRRLQHSTLYRGLDATLVDARLILASPYREGSTLGELLDLQDWIEDRRMASSAQPLDGEDSGLVSALEWLERHWQRLERLGTMLDAADEGNAVDSSEVYERLGLVVPEMR